MAANRRNHLVTVGVFVLVLAGAVALALHWLDHLALADDRLPFLLYQQPVWSANENRIAYLRIPSRLERDGHLVPLRREIWWTSRVGGQGARLDSLPATAAPRILGFVGQDQWLVFQPGESGSSPSNSPAGGSLTFSTIHLTDRELRRVRFKRAGISFIGLRGDHLYFERDLSAGERQPIPEGDSEAEPAAVQPGLEILSWTPPDTGFTHVVTIPGSAGERLSVANVEPSPDDRFLAIALRAGEDGPLGLWVYDSQTSRLMWTSIRADAKTMRIAWSPDSVGLLASSRGRQGGELFVLDNVMQTRHERLSSGSENVPLQPFWPSGQQGFILQSPDAVYRVDPRRLQTQRILDRAKLGLNPGGLTVSPQGNWAVFYSRGPDQDDLYVVSLLTLAPHSLLPPGRRRRARSSLLYQIAEGTHYALSRWGGGSSAAAGE